MSESVLAGVRVVETAGIAAELAGRLLADLGAEVWKIEPPAGAPSRDPAAGGRHFFEYYNAGKHGLVADADQATDRARFRALVAAADVWLDSTPPGQPPPLGLDFETARRARPALVVVRVTPFGSSGPHAELRSSDLVAQAAGGMVFTNGFPGETPLQGFGLQAYHAASMFAVIGTLLALLERRRSGAGQTVEVSLQEAVAGALEATSSAWNHERRVEVRRGPLHWSRAFRICRCRDGHVVLSLVCDWSVLVGWLAESGHGADVSGGDWEDFEYRRANADEAFAALERWAAPQRAREIEDGAQLRRLPFAAVRAPEALLENPQLAARGFFSTLPGTSLRIPGPPFRMSETGLRTRRPAPRLGGDSWPAPAGDAPVAPALRDLPGGRVLDGVRVLDFTHVVAGPLATRILADHGADVIKVERLTTLDSAERRGGFFGNLNRGKRSIVLNLRDPRGVDLARRLAARSDVVIDNFSARVLGEWGLDYEGLRALRPGVVAVGMSGFGKSGPHRDRVSFGPTLQAICGHTRLLAARDGEIAGWGFSHADVCAGMNGALAAIAALHHRARTGRGQFVDLSQLECVTAYMGPMLLPLANDGVAPTTAENRSQEGPAAPHGVYRCAGADRWVAIAAFGEAGWRRFVAAVDEPWTADPRFVDVESRLRHSAALDAAVECWTRRRAPEAVAAICQRRGVAAYVVADGEDLCSRDPHLRARGYWVSTPAPEGGRVVLDGPPLRLSRTPGSVERPGPLHGEHTDPVLREVLRLPAEEIARLRRARVVA